MMKIILVRHGQTTLNAARVVQPPDTPLSKHGQHQAKRVAKRLADEPLGALVSSDYARARETAGAIAQANGTPVEIRTSLRERNLGDVRGMAHAKLGDALYADDFQPPNGESWSLFHERIAGAWFEMTELAKGTQGPTVVVTHGLVCRSIVHHCLRSACAPNEAPIWFENTSVTTIEGPPWQVTSLNCTAHLDGLAPTSPSGAV